MIVALIPLLLVCALTQPEAQPAPRILLLPDVTLSAEDPLYLEAPPAVGWQLVPPIQPPYVRLRLWGLNFPPRIRADPIIALVPGSAPQPAVAAVKAARAPPVETLTATPAATAGEAGLSLAYYSLTTAGVDAWFDRRRGAWTASGTSSLTLSAEQPGSMAVEVRAERQPGPWGGGFSASAAASADMASGSALAAGAGLAAWLSGQGREVKAASRTDFTLEQLSASQALAGLLSEQLSLDWQGPVWGVYGSGLAFLRDPWSTSPPQLAGLARLGLRWQHPSAAVTAGAGLLYRAELFQAYPEASLEVRLWPELRLQAELASFLEAPVPFLMRTLYGSMDQADLLPQGGISARVAALLDVPERIRAGVSLAARDGDFDQVLGGSLERTRARQIGVAAEADWRVLDSLARRPRASVSLRATAGFPLPVPEAWLEHLAYRSVDAGLRLVFAGARVELFMNGHWGDVAVADLPTLIQERRALESGWLASLRLRWAARTVFAFTGGVELREPLAVRAMLGCVIQR